jgi:Flp pilus assembly protein TadD
MKARWFALVVVTMLLAWGDVLHAREAGPAAGMIGEAEGLIQEDRLEEAATRLNLATRVDPSNADAWNGLGCIAMLQDERALAERMFRKALEVDPNHASARMNEAILKAADKGGGAALQELFTLGKSRPDDPAVAYNTGTLLQASGAFALSIAYYDRVLMLDPTLAMAYRKRGAARLTLGDFKQAVMDFHRAWTADPTQTDAITDIGMVFLFCRVADEAVFYLKQAVKLNPASARAWYGLGRALGAAGNFRGAVPAFDRAIALAPQVSAFEVDRAWAGFLLDPVENQEYCAEVLHKVLAAHPYHRRAIEVAAALYDATRNRAGKGGAK